MKGLSTHSSPSVRAAVMVRLLERAKEPGRSLFYKTRVLLIVSRIMSDRDVLPYIRSH